MKKIELLENLEETRKLEEIGISYNFYWAYRNTQEIGLDLLNFDNVGFKRDHEEMIENLERFGIKEFTVSDQSSGLMEALESFKENGYIPSDVIQIATGYTNWNFEEGKEEKEYSPALFLKKN